MHLKEVGRSHYNNISRAAMIKLEIMHASEEIVSHMNFTTVEVIVLPYHENTTLF